MSPLAETGTPVAKQSEVKEQMEHLAKNLDGIDGKIDALFGRLENVLQTQTSEVSENKEGQTLVPLANELGQMVIRTTYFNERLNTLYQLLEN